MKHAVILNVGEGDDVQLVKLFDDAISAMGYARTAANEIHAEMAADDGNMSITEDLSITEGTDQYIFTLELVSMMDHHIVMVWHVHPFESLKCSPNRRLPAWLTDLSVSVSG